MISRSTVLRPQVRRCVSDRGSANRGGEPDACNVAAVDGGANGRPRSSLPAEVDAVTREARERFAAGYIQCMHDVHTFVSSCPGIDPVEAAELLNHLLESMPLNDEDRLRVTLPDPGYAALVSPAPSTASTDDLCSDLDETDSEQSHGSFSEEDVLGSPSLTYSKSVWRPW